MTLDKFTLPKIQQDISQSSIWSLC